MWTPEQFATDFKKQWEGGLSLDPADTGNWVGKTLVGSKYGVTPAALARFRNVPVSSITAKIMAALTFEEAGRLALADYYRGTGIDKLPWGRVPAIMFDFAYNAGVKRSVITLQTVIGTAADGILGPGTRAAYLKKLEAAGEAKLADLFTDERIRFYEKIGKPGTSNNRYLKGWKNRANYFRPKTAWWNRFGA